MHVRMKQHITGFRQGRPWPTKGGVLEVGDAEGARLIQAGYAVETEAPESQEEDADEGTSTDTGGQSTDPPGQDGAPSDQPDGEPGDEPGESGEAVEGEVGEAEWPRHVGGPVFELPDGTRVTGKDAAIEAYKVWLKG